MLIDHTRHTDQKHQAQRDTHIRIHRLSNNELLLDRIWYRVAKCLVISEWRKSDKLRDIQHVFGDCLWWTRCALIYLLSISTALSAASPAARRPVVIRVVARVRGTSGWTPHIFCSFDCVCWANVCVSFCFFDLFAYWTRQRAGTRLFLTSVCGAITTKQTGPELYIDTTDVNVNSVGDETFSKDTYIACICCVDVELRSSLLGGDRTTNRCQK